MAPKSDLSGTKWFIAAGALAGTIGGWALLARNPGQPPTATADANANIWDVLNQPLPTLASGGGSVILQGPTAEPVQKTVLRSVNAPPPAPAPQPIVITQSSR